MSDETRVHRAMDEVIRPGSYLDATLWSRRRQNILEVNQSLSKTWLMLDHVGTGKSLTALVAACVRRQMVGRGSVAYVCTSHNETVERGRAESLLGPEIFKSCGVVVTSDAFSLRGLDVIAAVVDNNQDALAAVSRRVVSRFGSEGLMIVIPSLDAYAQYKRDPRGFDYVTEYCPGETREQEKPTYCRRRVRVTAEALVCLFEDFGESNNWMTTSTPLPRGSKVISSRHLDNCMFEVIVEHDSFAACLEGNEPEHVLVWLRRRPRDENAEAPGYVTIPAPSAQ